MTPNTGATQRLDTTRRLPKRIVPLTLPAPYDDFHVTCWINAPGSLWKEATTSVKPDDTDEEKAAVEARVTAALQQIVVDHDLVDFDGEPYPAASDDAFWQEIPTEVGVVIVTAIQANVGKLAPPTAAP